MSSKRKVSRKTRSVSSVRSPQEVMSRFPGVVISYQLEQEINMMMLPKTGKTVQIDFEVLNGTCFAFVGDDVISQAMFHHWMASKGVSYKKSMRYEPGNPPNIYFYASNRK